MCFFTKEKSIGITSILRSEITSMGSYLYPVKVIYLYCNKEILQHTGIIFRAWQVFDCQKTVEWRTSRQLPTRHKHICHYSVLRCQYLQICCTQIWLTIYAIKIQGTLTTSHQKLDIYIYIFHLNSVVCMPDAHDQLFFCGYETWNNKETWKWYCINTVYEKCVCLWILTVINW